MKRPWIVAIGVLLGFAAVVAAGLRIYAWTRGPLGRQVARALQDDTNTSEKIALGKAGQAVKITDAAEYAVAPQDADVIPLRIDGVWFGLPKEAQFIRLLRIEYRDTFWLWLLFETDKTRVRMEFHEKSFPIQTVLYDLEDMSPMGSTPLTKAIDGGLIFANPGRSAVDEAKKELQSLSDEDLFLQALAAGAGQLEQENDPVRVARLALLLMARHWS